MKDIPEKWNVHNKPKDLKFNLLMWFKNCLHSLLMKYIQSPNRVPKADNKLAPQFKLTAT